MPKNYDVFISHASEDKDKIARPLAETLRSAGLNVWYDEFSLTLGDPLRQKIDEGLSQSNFGVVIFSPNFFAKDWPLNELEGLFSIESSGKKVILPIWHEIDFEGVARYSPMLSGRLAAKTGDGVDIVAEKILNVISPEQIYKTQRKNTIYINPKKVRLGNKKSIVKTPILICSQSDIPLHNVEIKISIVEKDVPSKSVFLEMDGPTTQLEGQAGRITYSADYLIYRGLDRDNNCEALIIVLHTLPPKCHREVIIYSESEKDSFADIEISSFKEEASSVVNEGKSSRVLICLNSNFNIGSITTNIKGFKP